VKHIVLICLLITACGDDVLTVEKLQDPSSCTSCHPKHFDQWSGSMHAYASDDPVFVAMNKRGQRDTNGELGTFCLKCHAPMAVASGRYTDANAGDFDPASLPSTERGITCYFCHNVDKVIADHNNGLVLANDQTMRGGAKNPVDSPAHHSAYDKLMDSDINESEMCGSCHDIVTPKGVPLERTYQEWQTTFFAKEDPKHHLTCGGCHMKSGDGVIAETAGLDVPFRTSGIHDHLWPAIDEALTPWPNMPEMAAGIKGDLDNAVVISGPIPLVPSPPPGGICLDPPGVLTIRIDSVSLGHKWPSGAAQDRRAWLEVIAYRADNSVVFETGAIPDGKDPEEVPDPNLFGMWDRTAKEDGTPAHFFWEVASHDDSTLLKAPVTLDFTDPLFDHATYKTFNIGPIYAEIDHITARIRIRPLPYRVLDELVASGDLDAAIASQLKTLEVAGTNRKWNKATAGMDGTPAMNTNCSPYGNTQN
jgi:hypothetical protein